MQADPKFVFTISDANMLADNVLWRKASLMVSLVACGLRIPETIFLLQNNCKDNLSEAMQQLQLAIEEIEYKTGRRLGSYDDPLLLAVRFSNDISNIGNISAILNLGMPLSGTVRIHGATLSDAILATHRRQLHGLLRRARGLDEGTLASPLEADQRTAVLTAIAEIVGTAVIVQVMRPSALVPGEVTGTIFSRDPLGLVSKPVGYFQVVCDMDGHLEFSSIESLREQMPEQYAMLQEYCRTVEEAFGGVCRIHFGIEQSTLYLLSIHRATAHPEVVGKLLVDQVHKGCRTHTDALQMIEPSVVGHSVRPQLMNEASLVLLGHGVSLGSELISGRIVVDSSTADVFTKRNEPTILVRENLVPEDVVTLAYAEGIIATKGGVASHMSVAAHGMGKACVAGIEGMSLLADKPGFSIGEKVIRQGEWITVDESKGAIFLGKGSFRYPVQIPEIEEILSWANDIRQIRVLVNAEDVREVQTSLQAGADGIGLCRSEHYILEPSVLKAFRCMMLSDDNDQRAEFLDAIETALENRLTELLRVLGGKPIHYRLLDTPINDLLPVDPESLVQIARSLKMEKLEIQKKISRLRETNSVLGCRGCRLGIVYPEIYRRQIKMALKSARKVASEGIPVNLTLVVPMVTMVSELEQCLSILRDEEIRADLVDRHQVKIRLGAMVETPRSALLSAELATLVDVLCFGTNDLTQATWAMSRDDTPAFLPFYREHGLIDTDPFYFFDEHGVGKLVQIAITDAYKANPDIQLYVCGEHAADPKNIKWFIAHGVNGVSCSAHHVTTVIVAAAQSVSSIPRKALFVTYKPRRQEYAARIMERIVAEVQRSNQTKAQILAMDWANEVSSYIGLDQTDVWKYFKRNLVERWFNRREYRRFEPGWSTEQVLEYARTLRGKKVRYSLFPRTIACHAVSEVLPEAESEREWHTRLEALDHSISMEVFPQQPESNLCFRAVLQDFVLQVEAGIGQAMYVFEKERGHHLVVGGTLDSQTLLVEIYEPKEKEKENLCAYEKVRTALNSLLNLFGIKLLVRCQDMCWVLGINWIAIEGYYDTDRCDPPFICDMDLPQDLAFHGS